MSQIEMWDFAIFGDNKSILGGQNALRLNIKAELPINGGLAFLLEDRGVR